MLHLLVLFLIPGLFGSAEGIFRRVCEHSHMTIDCRSEEIDIHRATYGRTQKGVCVFLGFDGNTRCYAGSSLRVARDRCQRHRSCTLHATNAAFGDPCVGTEKYLDVTYSCVPFRSPGSFIRLHRRVCEHSQLAIDCGSRAIDIQRATYGRTQKGVCVFLGFDSNTRCRAGSSLWVARRRCQRQRSCTLQATNAAFGDPCVGTEKYLDVTYRCVPRTGLSERMVEVCEGGFLSIHCHGNKRVHIMFANYGRLTGAQVCGGPIRTTNCRAPGSLRKVRRDCQRRPRCTLVATNRKFGDPCIGTFKYLEVHYNCQ